MEPNSFPDIYTSLLDDVLAALQKASGKVGFDLCAGEGAPKGHSAAYFADWFSAHGADILDAARKTIPSAYTDDDADALEYDRFALGKSVEAGDLDVLFATIADVLADISNVIGHKKGDKEHE